MTKMQGKWPTLDERTPEERTRIARDSIGQKPVEKQETTIVDRTPFEIKIIK